ncbi:uncharacterized protein [Labrus bergylta]|uniref:uncharacterized protein n=1 Tax=Labrus bergylta TaxID=56723 RepID=UPI0009B34DD4|nr:actin cytoskeleton-regulatory complex protein PAN1-like [Labrus bergylta]XP_029136698.1 actin cytoskeleton-regulatory complex protein PAN1-like [Labrus bergylta]
MYSSRSEHSQRGQYNERSSRQGDGYDDRWKERCESHGDQLQDSYHKHGGDRHRSAERTSRSREYGDSPKRMHSRDSLNRDWSRKSPVRRHMSSSDWGSSEKKRRRCTEDDEDDYKYRRETEDRSNRFSPDNFSRSRTTKDFKHSRPQDEDFKYSKTAQDSRHKYRHEEFNYRQQQDDLACRASSGYEKDRDSRERSWDRSRERKQSQDYTTKKYAKPRDRNDSPSTGYEDHRHNRARTSLNGSGGQSFNSNVFNQSSAAPEQKKAKGFQRFLDVLNKGVNVDMLTKIVTQNCDGEDDRAQSPPSFVQSADRPLSPSCVRGQQGRDKKNCHWSESVGPQRGASPHHRSFSPKRNFLPDERPLQRGEGERNCLSSSSRSRSPSVVEKTTLTPEEEHKRRQMQDVLQAIGMNLGFEELGQMSHRIQERLYGKRDSDREGHRRKSRERDTRRTYSPRLHSRSSSSRSSVSPPPQESDMKRDAASTPRDLTDMQQIQILQSAEYETNSSSNTFHDREDCETHSQEMSAVSQAFSQNHTYNLSEPSPPPVLPVYSPVNSSPLPFPALPPTLPPAPPPPLPPPFPPVPPPALPPALPPYMPHVGPTFLFPRQFPLPPGPRVPNLNLFPALLPPMRPLYPPHISNPPPFFNLPHVSPIPPINNTQNKKPQRPRCLQVIETKQA